MIGKIKNLGSGDHLARLAAYLRGPEGARVASFSAMNLSTSDMGDVVLLMDAQAGLSRRARKPIAHITVSYSPTDRVTPDEMLADAQRVLSGLGAEQAQAFMVVHDDKDYQHFHLVMNRVQVDGRCISDSNTKRKIESVLRKIESERGLRPVPGRHAAAIQLPEAGRFTGARAARRGYTQPPPEVVEAMRTAKSRRGLDARLAELGWRVETARSRPGQKAGGLVLFGPRGERARASDCGRECSGPALSRRFSTPAAHRPPMIGVAEPASLPRPKPSGAHALATALRKARAKPKMPSIAPRVSASGAITRVIRLTLPTPKF